MYYKNSLQSGIKVNTAMIFIYLPMPSSLNPGTTTHMLQTNCKTYQNNQQVFIARF
jgi:hypothetical protein